MPDPARVYLFRGGFAPAGDTVNCEAPLGLVAAASGGRGAEDADGVKQAFGGCTFWRDEETDERFLGVWDRRNAGRFRTALRQAGKPCIFRERPPARLTWWTSAPTRP
ncbi:hypothetical protein [Methylobacterium gnaphalii]|uniref:Uncharacterized protein n=1 Tax=Methylobacterium gnaphalii TaxID=1010610 RepID=A0A512JRH9_9HYPH|nr:hypothetical protein [Methylobacterium gnaphalii]GEP12541.1 hypothetical protein MGN01_43860 [Methylobacterium gnaphalii]GJD70209.1 hypothetical protein MMMDOFMJ_3151 [Methylobacterium gnaphalii]GLS51521.1 hypothetical protein GCM10007885_43790 [Methylobacterium gnaphalii]